MLFLVPNVDLPAICSLRFKPGPPGEEAQVLSDRLNDILVSYVHWIFLRPANVLLLV